VQRNSFKVSGIALHRYEIWHLECQEPLQDTLTDDSSERVGEVNVSLSGCTRGQMGEGWH
jgi:hypothetical protein